MIVFTLPLPPSSNKRVVPAINRKTGKPFLRRNERDSDFFETARRVFILTLGRPKVPRGPMRMHLDIWVPAYNYDSTNRIKTLEDSLEALAYENDFQVVEHRILRRLFYAHHRGPLGPRPPAPGVIIGLEVLERTPETVPWFAAFPLTRSGEPNAVNEPVAKVETRELATTPAAWAKRGLLKSAVIRYDQK